MTTVVAVTGARSITDEALVFKLLDERTFDGDVVFLTAGAKGVDSIVEKYAQQRGHKCVVFRPYFVVDGGSPFNPRHFFMCNKQLVEQCESAIVIHDGEDTKSKDMVARLERGNKPCEIIEVTA